MRRRRRARQARWIALGAGALLTLAALLSPWWECGLGANKWSATIGNGGLRVWWLTGARSFNSGLRVRVRLGTDQAFLGWRHRCNPHVWVPNAWLPLWMPLAPAWIAVAGVWVLTPRTYRRGRCPACGYDLSATPAGDQGVTCPECGEGSPAPSSPRAPATPQAAAGHTLPPP